MGTLYAASYCSTTGGFNSVQLFYPESTIIGIHTILLLQLNTHSHAKHPYYAEIKKKTAPSGWITSITYFQAATFMIVDNEQTGDLGRHTLHVITFM